MPFNKCFFKNLEFYSYGNDSPEIVLLPKEERFVSLVCLQKGTLQFNNFTQSRNHKHILNYNYEQRTMFHSVMIWNGFILLGYEMKSKFPLSINGYSGV